jgi:hypothetical protein
MAPNTYQCDRRIASSDSIEDVLRRVRETPQRLAVLSFFAAKIIARYELGYFEIRNRLLGQAMLAGVPENDARRRLYRGFAAAATKHDQPPAGLVLDRVEVVA